MSGEEMSPVVSQHVEVLIALSRMEGKVDAFAATGARHDDAIVKLTTEQASQRDRITALESARSATPPWWVVVGALVPAVALVMVLAEQFYGK